MEAIGHYDFGQNLRPLDFNSWLDRRKSENPSELGFWLEYWLASYQHLLSESAHLNFIDYDTLCEAPERGLRTLAEVVQSCNPEALISRATRIRQPRAKKIDTDALPTWLKREANSVYDRLRETATNH